jgi:uridine kinase
VPLVTRDPDDARAEAVRLAGLRAARCGPVRVVAVDGPSGSGKSTLAADIGRELAAPVVHMDDVYPGWDGLADAVPLVTTQVLEPLAAGRPAAYRRWDWVRHRWSSRRVPVTPTPLLVLEGVGASVLPAGDYASVCVWVEAEREIRFARGIARDGETYRPHWERWGRQEDALFAADATRDRADVVLDTTTL